jgi:hypothetical protein
MARWVPGVVIVEVRIVADVLVMTPEYGPRDV